MRRKKSKITILEYLETYIAERDLSPDYVRMFAMRVRAYSDYCGRNATLDDLQPAKFNKWLTMLQGRDIHANTVCGYRAAVRSLWNSAYEAELIDTPPLRLKRIKRPLHVVEAFNHGELTAILAEAEKVRGYLPNGVRASDMWRAIILLAYSTGLRRGDMLRLKRSQIRDDGSATVVQNKTGYQVRVKLSAEALAAIKKLKPDDNDERALPWPYSSGCMQVVFARLVKRAGVRIGQFRWLRRSAGSYAESVTPGAGARLLGHRDERVFRAHYEDADISRPTAIEPPAIAAPTIAIA